MAPLLRLEEAPLQAVQGSVANNNHKVECERPGKYLDLIPSKARVKPQVFEVESVLKEAHSDLPPAQVPVVDKCQQLR